MTKKVSVNYADYTQFIDPASCGSHIGYRIGKTAYNYFEGNVVIGDCTHKVNWSFGGNEASRFKSNLKKIDEAIVILNKFKDDYVLAYHTFKAGDRKSK